MTTVGIVNTGVTNVASVRAAFRRLNVPTTVCQSPADLATVTHVVLPGVGSYQAVAGLRESGWDRIIVQTIESGRPLLAICLGLQMLCEGSAEVPEVEGLGVIPGRCRPLPDDVPTPHLGWNWVAPTESGAVPLGAAAFANSFALFEAPGGWKSSWTTHGEKFVAALERDNVLACQFHPELSGSYGLGLLRGWLSGTPSAPTVQTGVEPAGAMSRIIPCLDVCRGRVVKGVRFQELRDVGDPSESSLRYELEGADEIVILDIAAAPDQLEHRVDVVASVRERVGIPLTVGGGVRCVDDARALLRAGADKTSVNTAAVTRPSLVAELASEFGSQCIVVAIDAKRVNNGWEVRTVGGRNAHALDAVDWAKQCVDAGAGEILLTSWDRDGTREGYDTDLIEAVTSRVGVPVIASGGGGSAHDVLNAFRSGAHAVLAASIFHDRDMTVAQLKEYLANSDIRVRL